MRRLRHMDELFTHYLRGYRHGCHLLKFLRRHILARITWIFCRFGGWAFWYPCKSQVKLAIWKNNAPEKIKLSLVTWRPNDALLPIRYSAVYQVAYMPRGKRQPFERFRGYAMHFKRHGLYRNTKSGATKKSGKANRSFIGDTWK